MRTIPLLVFLAACAVSTPRPGDEPVPVRLPQPPAAPAADGLLEALSGMVPERRMSPLAAAPVPQPAQVLVDRQLSVTVAGHLDAVQVDSDKSWMVQVPASGCTVTAIASSRGPVSGVWNLRGDNNDDVHGRTFPMPMAAKPGDVLILTSGSEGGNDVAPWRFAPTGSAIDEALSIHFVDFPVHRGLLHGPAIGDGPIPRFFRSFPIDSALVDLSKLPSVIDIDALGVDWSVWGSYRPTIENTLRLYGGGRFSADFFTGWGLTSSRSPWTQHQGYGTFYAGALSTSALMLCSTLPVEEKRPLAMLMVQHGLDHLGAFADLPRGRWTYPLGGHCWGRKFPVVLAGHLLNVDPIKWISHYLGPVFAEDTGFTAGMWWFDAPQVGSRHAVDPITTHQEIAAMSWATTSDRLDGGAAPNVAARADGWTRPTVAIGQLPALLLAADVQDGHRPTAGRVGEDDDDVIAGGAHATKYTAAAGNCRPFGLQFHHGTQETFRTTGLRAESFFRTGGGWADAGAGRGALRAGPAADLPLRGGWTGAGGVDATGAGGGATDDAQRAAAPWNSVWHFDLSFPRDILAQHPSTWPPDFVRLVAYMGQVVPAQIGTALACELMGLTDAHSPHLLPMVRQHVQGPPASAIADLTAAGVGPLHWGTDYAVPAGFAVAAWRRYYVP